MHEDVSLKIIYGPVVEPLPSDYDMEIESIAAPDAAAIPYETLGFFAVESDTTIARLTITPEGPVIQQRIEDAESTRHLELFSIRSSLKRLSEEQHATLNYYLESNIPGYFKAIKAAKGKSGDNWGDWLGSRDNESHLLTFLHWHIDKLKRQTTNPEVQAMIEQIRQDYKIAVQKGIDEGWLHSDAQYAIEAVDSIQVYIGDVFDTLIKDRAGYCISGTDYVVVSGAEDSLGYTLDRVLMHEFNHAVLGQFGDRWLNEALTEHLAQVLRGKRTIDEFKVTNPGLNDNLLVYEDERSLLRLLLHTGKKPVPVLLLTRAYSKFLSKHPESRAAKHAIDRSWGVQNTLDILNNHIGLLEDAYNANGETEHNSQRKAVLKTSIQLRALPHEIFGKGFKSPCRETVPADIAASIIDYSDL
jgi:hypothetical protein